MTKFYHSLARWSFYLMVLLVPITFLPWTVDGLELNKQTLVLILSSVAVIAWLGVMIVEKKFSFKKSWLFTVVGLFLLSTAISSAFSLAPYTSWVGSGAQEYTSFVSLLAFGLIFIVGSHFLSEAKVQQKVWSLSLIASALVGLSITFSLAGLQIFSTNFIGTPNALALYLVAMSVLGAGLWLVASEKENAADALPSGAMGIVVRK